MSHRPKSTGIDAIAALSAALGASSMLTPEQATAQGYVTCIEYAKRIGVCQTTASRRLGQSWRNGLIDRVLINRRQGAPIYGYRAKMTPDRRDAVLRRDTARKTV